MQLNITNVKHYQLPVCLPFFYLIIQLYNVHIIICVTLVVLVMGNYQVGLNKGFSVTFVVPSALALPVILLEF